jgi:hypothetical protein
MAFLARYNYLYRIGALSPTSINAPLKVDVPVVAARAATALETQTGYFATQTKAPAR